MIGGSWQQHLNYLFQCKTFLDLGYTERSSSYCFMSFSVHTQPHSPLPTPIPLHPSFPGVYLSWQEQLKLVAVFPQPYGI